MLGRIRSHWATGIFWLHYNLMGNVVMRPMTENLFLVLLLRIALELIFWSHFQNLQHISFDNSSPSTFLVVEDGFNLGEEQKAILSGVIMPSNWNVPVSAPSSDVCVWAVSHPHHRADLQLHSTQLWHHLPGDSLRPHRWRRSPTRLPLLHLMPMTSPGCHLASDLPTDRRFQWPPIWVQLIC